MIHPTLPPAPGETLFFLRRRGSKSFGSKTPSLRSIGACARDDFRQRGQTSKVSVDSIDRCAKVNSFFSGKLKGSMAIGANLSMSTEEKARIKEFARWVAAQEATLWLSYWCLRTRTLFEKVAGSLVEVNSSYRSRPHFWSEPACTLGKTEPCPNDVDGFFIWIENH